MKFLSFFHLALVISFAALNGIMLYLFMLQLPFGLDPFLISLAAWDKLSPQIVYVAIICGLIAVAGTLLVQRLSDMWKNRLLYARVQYPHPANDVFLSSRKQPFEAADLQQKFSRVKDAGFSRKVQIEVWQEAYQRQSSEPVVLNTRIHWNMLRDLYVLALYFLVFFLIGWVINLGVPFQIVAIYLFLYGTQTLFLMLTARRTGYRLVDNVLALELGLGDEAGKSSGRGGK